MIVAIGSHKTFLGMAIVHVHDGVGEGTATAVAGAFGTLIMFGLACVVGRVFVRTSEPRKTTD